MKNYTNNLFFLLAFILCFPFIGQSQNCTNNLLTNPGFEDSNTDITGWFGTTFPPTFSISNDAFSGNNALQIGGTLYTKVIQELPASPGDIFTISAQIKAVTQNHLLRIRFRDASDNIITTYQEAEPFTGEYQQTSITTIGAPNNTASVSAVILKLPNPGDIFVDDFCLIKENPNPCLFDTSPPVITGCPSSLSFTAPFGSGGTPVTWLPITAEDDCSGVSLVSASHNSGDFFPIGNTSVNIVFSDVAGNEATCSFLVTVLEGSSGICSDNLLDNPGYEFNNQNTAFWYQDGALDFSLSNDAFSDNNALMVSGSAYGGILQSLPATPGETYNVSAYVKQTENIGFLQLRFTTSSYQPIPGASYVNSLPANGQYQELSINNVTAPTDAAFVFVALQKTSATSGSFLVDAWCLSTDGNDPCNPDLTPPSISDCPQNINIESSNNGEIVNWTPPTATDVCSSSVFLDANYSPGDFFPMGQTVVTYTAIDPFGNNATCSFIVNIEVPSNNTCVDNLLENEGYEDSNNNYPEWTPVGATNFSISNDANSGANATEISGPFYGGIVQNVPGEVGVEYTASVQIKQTENIGFMRLKFLSSTYQPIYTESAAVAASGEYQTLSVSYVAPANTAFVEVGIYKSSGTDGSFLVDDWCLTKEGNNQGVDLSIENAEVISIFEAGKGGLFSFNAVNTSNSEFTFGPDELFSLTVFLSDDPQQSPDDVLIGYRELNALPSGNSPFSIPILIPEDTETGQEYYFITTIDQYNAVVETNEDNNSVALAYTVIENSGSPCAKTFGIGDYYTCAETLPSGDLRVVTALPQSAGPIYFENIINEAGELVSFDPSSGPIPPTKYEIENGNLLQLNSLDVVINTIPISPNLLAQFENLLDVALAFDNGYILFDLSPDKTVLHIIKTDAQLNIEYEELVPTLGRIDRLETPVILAQNRFAFVYNENTGFQGSNNSNLVIMDSNLTLITTKVISSLSGAVGIALPANLQRNSCGLWTYNSSAGNAGGGGGGISIRSESNGTYRFENDEFVFVKSYNDTNNLTFAGGNTNFTRTRSFSGVDPDGNILMARRSYNVRNSFPPFDYIPANEVLELSKQSSTGEILWERELSSAEVYPFTEFTNIDCDNNQANNPLTTYPVDCPVASDFPWREWISRVQIGNLDKASGKSTYSDFTSELGAVVLPGSTANIAVDVSFSYFANDQYFSVYIDFNGNGLFENNEITQGALMGLNDGTNVTYTWNGTIGVPLDAMPGAQKMRIIMNRGSYADSPCGSIPFGEIEDYTFTVPASGSNFTQHGEQEETIKSVQLFPNPAQQYVNVDLSDFEREEVHIEIVNQLGQSIYNNLFTSRHDNYERIDLSAWKNGYYLVWVKPESSGRRAGKLVVTQDY